ncbi:MAG: hypothetical protein AAGE80_02635 [Pseudomonadota bacterium]
MLFGPRTKGALLGLTLATAPFAGAADELSFRDASYTGRVVEIASGMLRFDLGCSGEIYQLPLSQLEAIEFTEDCSAGELSMPEREWMGEICDNPQAFGAAPAFWSVNAEAGAEHWTNRFEGLDDAAIRLTDLEGKAHSVSREGTIAVMITLQTLCAD